MREIKFRGMTATMGWVYGLPLSDLPYSTAYYDEYSQRICWHPKSGGAANAPIKNGTLGQFTGLYDKNGKEIYEKDVVEWLGYEVRNNLQIRPERRIVVGRGFVAPQVVAGDYILDCYHLQNLIKQGDKSCEVVGNVYETPELLEVEE